MSRRQSDIGSSGRRDAEYPGPWRPIRLVQLDVDAPGADADVGADDGSRVWVEVIDRGSVVGLVESDGEQSASSLRALIDAEVDDARAGDAPARVPDDQLPTATVVIPTICKNPAQLQRTVDALLAMDHPDFEIIVVDNRGGGPPLPPFAGGDRVRVVNEPVRGISSARNRGTSVATGEIVAFTDDDAVVDAGWLRALGTRFATSPEVDAVGGLVLPLELDTEAQLWFEEFYGGFSRSFRPEIVSVARPDGADALFPYAPGRFGAGCNLAFRRATLQRMGGFDVSLGVGTPAKGGEDLAMSIRLITAGGTIAFEPAALVRHSHRATKREFMRQVVNYGTGLAAMYTSIVVSDPHHLAAIARRVPAGARLLLRPRGERSRSRAPSYPRRTLAYQLAGMAYGPIAYARSAVRARGAR